MRRVATVIVAAMLAAVCTVHAQDGNPLSKNMKESWTNIRDLLTKMADLMPADEYRFKATPQLQDFGQRMAHAVQFMMRGCAQANGDQKAVTFSRPYQAGGACGDEGSRRGMRYRVQLVDRR